MKRLILMSAVLSVLGGSLQAQDITGVGSTFAAPLYQRWAQEYRDKAGVTINYQPLGSGAGVTYIIAHYTDFGASDAPLNDLEMKAAPGIVHIPTVAGAVVVAYNIPGVGPGIHLTGDVVADIFLGNITNWNDPRISRLSPGTRFPNLAITTCHRSDGSGTTNIFTNYLNNISPAWKAQIGAGKAVHWPNGDGLKGNLGVATAIKQQPGSIGYIELAFAIENDVFYAAIQNGKKNFIYPSAQSALAAAAGATLPADFRVSLITTNAREGYPITGFTYILVYEDTTKPALKSFLIWGLTEGQKDAAVLQYVPLPATIQKRALAAVQSLK